MSSSKMPGRQLEQLSSKGPLLEAHGRTDFFNDFVPVLGPNV